MLEKSDLPNGKLEVLKMLAILQSDRSAPIELSIGAVEPKTQQVLSNVIVVHNAPPAVVRALVNNFKLVALRPDGLHVPVTVVAEER